MLKRTKGDRDQFELPRELERTHIRRLQEDGLKTEPAFARYFALAGEPYAAVLALAGAPDAELAAIVVRGGASAG